MTTKQISENSVTVAAAIAMILSMGILLGWLQLRDQRVIDKVTHHTHK